MENQDDKSLMEIFQKERFLAFFDICKIDEGGNGELDGLCKVAVSQEYPKADYMSLVFIFDTPSEGKSALAKRLLAKLSTEVFKRNLSGICAVTSVPGSVRQSDHYIHHIDLIFTQPISDSDIKERVNKIVLTIRQTMGVDTEAPQWWEESSAPKPSEDEKANWTERIKAFLKIKK